MNTLFFEIITEEIPASYILPALRALGEITGKKLAEAGLEHGEIKTFGTPRRMAITVAGVPARQAARSRKVSGPPKKSAVAPDGSFTNVAIGFAKKYGVGPEKLQTENTPKGEYLYLMVEDGGRDTKGILREILPSAVQSLPFPKTMRWGNGELRFARPIRALVALFGGEVVDFEIEGIKAGNMTLGHRFISAGSVAIGSPDGYEAALEKAGVTADPEKRKAAILRQFDEMEKSGVRPVRHGPLIEEVCNLTENPVAVTGSFKEKYLELPRELLTTVMMRHQRYFPVEDASGKLVNSFVAFSNIRCADMAPVRRGYERVLEARLSDARFFFDEDRKHPLEHFDQKLSGITYQKGLGTVKDKVERIIKISEMIANELINRNRLTKSAFIDVVKVAELCKFDLATQMVFEFPELQGIMGREYAKASGENDAIARAIDEHYRPRFSGDALPSSDIAAIVALADKLDTICGCFALGLIPTGSQDPFALRRHALGVIRILEERQWASPGEWVAAAIEHLPDSLKKNKEGVRCDVMEFINARVKNELLGKGFAQDIVNAMMDAGFRAGLYSIKDSVARCEAMAEMKKLPHAEALATTFRRAANIVKDQKDNGFEEEELTEKAEKALLASLKEREKNVGPLLAKKDYAGALKEIAEIRGAVDAFFDGVMVMDKDMELRRRRLGILRRVTNLFADLADFSKLVF